MEKEKYSPSRFEYFLAAALTGYCGEGTSGGDAARWAYSAAEHIEGLLDIKEYEETPSTPSHPRTV